MEQRILVLMNLNLLHNIMVVVVSHLVTGLWDLSFMVADFQV